MSEKEVSTDSNMPSSEPKDFEHALKELEQIVRELEQGDLPLSSSLNRYERGVKLVGTCEQLLSEVENRIVELQSTGSVKEFNSSPTNTSKS